jgi:hypothetical protein
MKNNNLFFISGIFALILISLSLVSAGCSYTPIYRCVYTGPSASGVNYNNTNHDHMTTFYSDCEAGFGTGVGYANEGILGYVYNLSSGVRPNGTDYVTRCWNPILSDHDTVSGLGNCLTGYNEEADKSKIAPISLQPGTFQLKRCFNPGSSTVNPDYITLFEGESCPSGYTSTSYTNPLFIFKNTTQFDSNGCIQPQS